MRLKPQLGNLLNNTVLATVAALALLPTLHSIHSYFAQPQRMNRVGNTVATVSELSRSGRKRAGDELIWRDTFLGDAVCNGDAFYAPEGSSILLRFNDGSELRVFEHSLVVVDNPGTASQASSVQLRAGRITGVGGSQGLRVQSTHVRTDMPAQAVLSVIQAPGGADRVVVHSGTAVAHSHAGPQQLAAKEELQVGEKTARTRGFSVTLVGPALGAEQLVSALPTTVRLTWEGAGGARVQVARHADFAPLEVDAVAGAAAVHDVRIDAPGTYYWRVTDATGAALSADGVFLVSLDLPPRLLEPAHGAVIYRPKEQPHHLTWEALPGVESYDLQIAGTATFEKVLVERRVQGTIKRFIEELPEGIYFWRVRAADARRQAAPFSETRGFRLITEPLPRPPKLFDPELEAAPRPSGEQGSLLWWLLGGVAHAAEPRNEAVVVLRWEAVPDVAGYELQVADDEAFQRPILSEEVPTPYYRWRQALATDVWWRVRSIDTKGRKGQFSAARVIAAAIASPEPLGPKHATTLTSAQALAGVPLSWTAQRFARAYRVEIARKAGAAPIVQHDTGDTTWSWSAAEVGTFYWCVRSIDTRGSASAAPNWRRLDVLPAAPRLRVEPTVTFGEEQVWATWEPGRAQEYDVEVAPSADFTTRVHSATVREPRLVWAAPSVARFHVRVRGRERGVASPWSEPGSTQVRLAAPKVISPAADARIETHAAGSVLEIAWGAVAGALAYRVDLFAAGSTDAVFSQSTGALTLTLETPAVGKIDLGVTATADDAAAASPTTHVSLELVRLQELTAPTPQSPESVATLVDATEVVFIWSEVDQAADYELQWRDAARDGAAWSPLVGEGPQAQVALGPGRYAWRVRARDAQGRAGPFSRERALELRRLGRAPESGGDGDEERRILLGAALANVVNGAAAFGAAVEVHVGTTHAWRDVLFLLLLRTGYHSTELNEPPGVRATQYVVPSALGAYAIWPWRWVDFYGGAALLVGAMRARLEVSGQPNIWQNELAMGGELALGALRHVPIGALFFEQRFGYLRASAPSLRLDGGGFTSSLGLRVAL